MLISSLSDKVMPLAVGRRTSQAVCDAVKQFLASFSRASSLNLLGQLQPLRQGDSLVANNIGRAQVIVEDLALVGRPITLDKQNLYVFRGLRPKFHSLTASLAVRGQLVTLQELTNFLGAQEFIVGDDYGGSSLAAFFVKRGG